MDAVFLSRVQFGLTIAFHYIFPPLTIGLGMLLMIMEGVYLKTRDPFYLMATKFWVKVFALIFSIGVATGIVMEFQFGTNWSNYSRFVGDVFGSALAAEGIFAFFLESGFLAILLFGWDRVGPKLHFFATCMVALGSMFSAVWIIVANSWMQTPAGYHIVPTEMGGTRAEITDFWSLVFNPSSMDRLWHTVMGAWQAGSWLVISVSAYYLLKKRHERFAKFSIKVGLSVALAASLLQLLSGHEQAKIVAQYQPEKLAAFEGHWVTEAAPMYLFGWVDGVKEVTHGVSIPGMLSWLTYGDATHPVQGLHDFGKDIPPVNAVFQSYHAMIAIGFTLIGLSVIGCILWWWGGRIFRNRFLLTVFVWAVLLPEAANQLGWYSAEVGRQPWIVWHLMRTADGTSPTVKAPSILASVILFSLIYLLLFVLFIYLLDHKIKVGPEEHAEEPHDVHLMQGDRANL